MEEAKDEPAAENDAHNLALQAAAQLNGQVEIGLVHLRHCSRAADYSRAPAHAWGGLIADHGQQARRWAVQRRLNVLAAAAVCDGRVM